MRRQARSKEGGLPAAKGRAAPRGALVWLVSALVAAACAVDTAVPDDALLTCLEDAHCPEGWSCDPASSLCLSPGAESPIEPELAEARRAFCEALYDAAEPCMPELEEALGEAALIFTLPEPTFLHMCVTNILADTTMDDVNELTAGAAFIPMLDCESLAEMLAEQILEQEG